MLVCIFVTACKDKKSNSLLHDNAIIYSYTKNNTESANSSSGVILLNFYEYYYIKTHKIN